MKSKKYWIILTTILILGLLLIACGKKQETTVPVNNPEITQEVNPSTEQTEVVAPPLVGAPEDVPIIPDAYDVEITDESNQNYKVDLPLKDVVEYYQTELPKNGWDQINNPDSVVGQMAQMTRSKTNGDRINFSLQYNPVGEFSLVTIYITRAP
jgi:hypothetical protein